MCSTKRELSNLPLPLGEAGRRPGEGAFLSGTLDESTLTPALSQRERENENRQQRCKIRDAVYRSRLPVDSTRVAISA